MPNPRQVASEGKRSERASIAKVRFTKVSRRFIANSESALSSIFIAITTRDSDRLGSFILTLERFRLECLELGIHLTIFRDFFPESSNCKMDAESHLRGDLATCRLSLSIDSTSTPFPAPSQTDKCVCPDYAQTFTMTHTCAEPKKVWQACSHWYIYLGCLPNGASGTDGRPQAKVTRTFDHVDKAFSMPF